MNATRPPPPLADSPWFWVYLFSTAGLLGLALVGPKHNEKQLAEERRFQGRQRVLDRSSERSAPAPQLATPETSRLNLRPLAIILAVPLVIGWAALVRQRRRARARYELESAGDLPPPEVAPRPHRHAGLAEPRTTPDQPA